MLDMDVSGNILVNPDAGMTKISILMLRRGA